jgi:hypothetical protein
MPETEDDLRVLQGPHEAFEGPLEKEDEPVIRRMPQREREEETLTSATPSITPSVAGNINSMRGAGTPLSPSVRAYFEPRFGAHFGQVRVHTDTQAANTARAVQARAFTVGRDVVFGASEYAPTTMSGRKLLAHELTHVIQQSRLTPGFPTHSRPPSHGLVQRQPKDKPKINYARA